MFLQDSKIVINNFPFDHNNLPPYMPENVDFIIHLEFYVNGMEVIVFSFKIMGHTKTRPKTSNYRN